MAPTPYTKPTIGLLGVSGLLGSHLLTALASAHASGALTLIVLARASSDTSNVPSTVEKRVLDADNASLDEVSTALKGIDILISSIKQSADGAQKFIENLAQIKTLKVYVPSYFTANWTPEEAGNKENVYLYGKASLKDRAIALGIPVTTIHNGLFEGSFLDPAFFGLDAEKNVMTVFGDALRQKFSFLSLPYLGAAVAQLVTHPAFAAGKQYTIVEAEFTGQDVADAFETVKGSPPTVNIMTPADIQAMQAAGPGPGLGAAWRMHWGSGNWNVVNLFEPVGIPKRTLLDAVKDAADGDDDIAARLQREALAHAQSLATARQLEAEHPHLWALGGMVKNFAMYINPKANNTSGGDGPTQAAVPAPAAPGQSAARPMQAAVTSGVQPNPPAATTTAAPAAPAAVPSSATTGASAPPPAVTSAPVPPAPAAAATSVPGLASSASAPAPTATAAAAAPSATAAKGDAPTSTRTQ